MKVDINGKNIVLEKVVEGLKNIPSKQLAQFLIDGKIELSRTEIRGIFKEMLDNKIDAISRMDSMTMEYVRRLKYYDNFTLYQMAFLASRSGAFFSYDKFREKFFEYLIINREEIGLNDLKLMKLINMSIPFQNSSLMEENPIDFVNLLKPSFKDNAGFLDGILADSIISAIANGTTLEDIKMISDLNGVNIPKRLKKKELVELIKFSMKKRNISLSNEMELLLDNSTNTGLEKIATMYAIPAKIELKKDGILEYLLMQKGL